MTFEWDAKKLEEEFPVVISQDLRTNAEGTRIAIINNFEEGSKLMDLADPKAEEDDADVVFYHAFLDEIFKAKALFENFIALGACENPESIVLLRNDSEKIFMYSNGCICKSVINHQDELHNILPNDLMDREVFVLPLKRYMHKCPVCGHRTLVFRGCFDICGECGWEDEGIDGDDEAPHFGPNGSCTIRQYRETYLKVKANNPDYKWWKK